MTLDTLSEIRAAYERILHIGVDENSVVYCEGVTNGSLKKEEALKEIAFVWNSLDTVLSEVSALSEDCTRMTHILYEVNQKVVSGLQGTARMNVPPDWWQING